jgi:ribosomal protein L20A (L18A)
MQNGNTLYPKEFSFMSQLSQVKVFRITGHYTQKHRKFSFSKDLRALTKEQALDQVLSTITSQGFFRRQVKIDDVKEIKPEESKDYVIKYLNDLK